MYTTGADLQLQGTTPSAIMQSVKPPPRLAPEAKLIAQPEEGHH